MSLFKYFKRTATTSASSIGMNLKLTDSESENSECVTIADAHASTSAEASYSECSYTTADIGKDQVKRKQAKEFKAEWKKTREWLVYLPGNGMFCSLCQKYDKCPFGRDHWNKSPCQRIRFESILAHENSFAHRDAIKSQLAATLCGDIRQVVLVAPAISVKAMEQAFTCLYFLAKHRIPQTTNFEPLLDLVGYLGVSIKKDISMGKNATYTSDKTIQEMIFIISEVLQNQILQNMLKSDHFAIMLDETTDCTVAEQLAIHGRFIHKESGELKSHFLKVVDCLQPEIDAVNAPNHGDNNEEETSTCISVNAKTITKRIIEFTEEANLDMNKLRGIGTDGASTMVGCKSGVVTRLKKTTPSAIGVHCTAHRLNLASSQAGDAVPYVKKFQQILRQLFDFFDNSAVRMAGLQSVQALIHEKGKLLAPCSTRWLSTERSVQRLKD